MSTINWTSAADFGFEDNFVSQVLGNITTTQAGSYTFRLSSDDGSKLSIDNAVVINHDGLHGATPPKEGTVTLTAGLHALRIDHFERGGGQQITLEWKTPGSSTFAVVPNSALSTDAGVVRVTAPGRKECEGVSDSPGDGLPLTGVHPGYTLTSLRPGGFQPKVTGMDWLADGRLVISTWGGSDQSGTSQDGEVWILGNTGGSTSPGSVTTKKIAGGLKEPMGLKVVDGVVYVTEKQRLTRLVNTGGDEAAERLETVATWPYGGNFHEFAFGLLYQDGFFYLNLSVSINSGGATTNPQPATNRGTTLKVNKDTGAVSYVAGGLRTPHGIGWGPEGGIFVTDNQGGWLPSSKLVHVKQGRFFNHFTNPAGPFDTALVTQPVLWMPQNEIANSPSTPLYLTSGRYAGQFVIGDVTYGGLQRANVEKVNGEYQGALFRLTQGLEAGVSEVNVGPDGAIYVGGLGAGGNWGQTGKLAYGLQKLTPNTATTFEMLAMRATTTGFEVEYTQPVSAETAAELAARYKIKQWRYVATSSYGGPKIDEETLPSHRPPCRRTERRSASRWPVARPAGWCTCARPARSPPPAASHCGAPRRGTRSTPSRAVRRRPPVAPSPASAASAWTSTTRAPPTARRSSSGPATAPPRSRGRGSGTRTGCSASAWTWTTPAPRTARRFSSGPATAPARRSGSRRATGRSATRSPARSWRPPAVTPPTAPRSSSARTRVAHTRSGWSVAG